MLKGNKGKPQNMRVNTNNQTKLTVCKKIYSI